MQIAVQTSHYLVRNSSFCGVVFDIRRLEGNYIRCVGSDGTQKDLCSRLKELWAPWDTADFLAYYVVNSFK